MKYFDFNEKSFRVTIYKPFDRKYNPNKSMKAF